MKPLKRNQFLLLIAIIVLPLHSLSAQDLESLVSPFKGSTHLGNYQSRFASLTLLVVPLDANKNPSTLIVEGALNSNIYKRPAEVSPFEVFMSYKKVLENADFDLLLACESGKCNVKQKVKSIYGYPKKELESRNYGSMSINDKGYLVGWASHYLSAKKKTEDKTYFVMIIISSQRDLYSVDVSETNTMREGTVELAPELLKAKIKSEGKAVLHGIYFETGKDIITDQSKPALNAIATYLKDNARLSFYVVGHTDDTGDLDSNISLSKGRAKAVIEELKKYSVNTSQLMDYGAGPFSPLSTNQSDGGKSINRRVELVLRLN